MAFIITIIHRNGLNMLFNLFEIIDAINESVKRTQSAGVEGFSTRPPMKEEALRLVVPGKEYF